MGDLARTIAIVEPSTDALVDCPMSTYAWPGLVLIAAHAVVPATLWVSLLFAWWLVSVFAHRPVVPRPHSLAHLPACVAPRILGSGTHEHPLVALRTFCTTGWTGPVADIVP